MKKIIYLIIFLLTFFISCSNNNEISINKIGKNEYYIGEEFDVTGYTINVTIKGYTKELILEETMLENTTLDNIGYNELKIVYVEGDISLTTTFNVLVKETDNDALQSISISQYGKTEYFVGESFDIADYKIEVSYESGNKETLDLTLDMIDKNSYDYNKLLDINDSNIKIYYKQDGIIKTCNIDIIVKKIEPIELILLEKGLDYYTLNQQIDIKNYKFLVKYNNGSEKEVELDLENCMPYEFEENVEDEPVDTIVTFSYTEKDTTVTTETKVLVYSEWSYEELIEKKEEAIYFEKIYEDMNNSIPEEITEDLKFPSASDYNYKYKISISTSDYNIISPTGKVNFDDEDQIVTITMIVKSTYSTMEHSWSVIVKGLGPVKLRTWDSSKKHIFGYFYEATSQTMDEEDAKKIDVINYCFATVSNGKCSISGLKYFKENLKLRRSTGVRIVLSLNGASKENYGFSDACLTKESRKIFIDSMMEILKNYKFDGFDIDWEYPSWDGLADSRAEDRINFTLFLKELREALDNYKEGLLLTAALIGGNNVERFYEVSEINKYLDYAHIMTYDLNNSGISSHHTNPLKGSRAYSAKTAIENYESCGMDVEKMVIGAAFYGKISKLTTKTTPENALNKPVESTNTIQYTTIYDKYLNNVNYKKIYDESTGAYYLSDGEYFITYDDQLSIIKKCQMTKQYNLAGIMFWDYGSDTTKTLLKTMASEINSINFGR